MGVGGLKDSDKQFTQCKYNIYISIKFLFSGKIRNEERKILAKVGFIQSFLLAIIPTIPTAAVVITFLVHTLLKYPLTAPQV